MEREQMESAAGGARGFVARPDAAVAAVAGPVLKALDPKETTFGRGSE